MPVLPPSAQATLPPQAGGGMRPAMPAQAGGAPAMPPQAQGAMRPPMPPQARGVPPAGGMKKGGRVTGFKGYGKAKKV